jgi:hypothetical protein
MLVIMSLKYGCETQYVETTILPYHYYVSQGDKLYDPDFNG